MAARSFNGHTGRRYVHRWRRMGLWTEKVLDLFAFVVDPDKWNASADDTQPLRGGEGVFCFWLLKRWLSFMLIIWNYGISLIQSFLCALRACFVFAAIALPAAIHFVFFGLVVGLFEVTCCVESGYTSACGVRGSVGCTSDIVYYLTKNISLNKCWIIGA